MHELINATTSREHSTSLQRQQQNEEWIEKEDDDEEDDYECALLTNRVSEYAGQLNLLPSAERETSDSFYRVAEAAPCFEKCYNADSVDHV